jgi:hypothetical protein
VLGTVLAALFTDDITAARWTAQQPLRFRETILIAGLTLTGIAAALVP